MRLEALSIGGFCKVLVIFLQSFGDGSAGLHNQLTSIFLHAQLFSRPSHGIEPD